MNAFRASLLGLAILAGSSISATAADLGNYHDDEDHAVASNSRFYLRGDAQYSWFRAPSMDEVGLPVTDVSIGHGWGVGGGIGVYLSPNWRMDVTAEHRSDISLHGHVNSADVKIAGERDFSVSSNVVLANVYYDFSGRAGFNPYVGVGLGWSSNNAHNGVAVDACKCVSSIESATQSNFAWALMAGVTRELDRGFNLDVGYRLIDTGRAHTGNVMLNAKNGGGAIANSDPATSDIYANEIRVGLRYDIQ